MQKVFDVAIFGGGVVGSSVFNMVTRCGKSAILLELNDIASGESKARSEFSECGTQGAHKAPVRDFREPEDAALLLKALDGLQRFLDRAKNEGESEKSSAFWQIDNIDCSKI